MRLKHEATQWRTPYYWGNIPEQMKLMFDPQIVAKYPKILEYSASISNFALKIVIIIKR